MQGLITLKLRGGGDLITAILKSDVEKKEKPFWCVDGMSCIYISRPICEYFVKLISYVSAKNRTT